MTFRSTCAASLRTAMRALIPAALCAFLLACENRPRTWKEDVQLLPDGPVVTLKRYQEFRRPHAPGDSPGPSYHWLEFKHPTTGELVRWEEAGELMTIALLMADEMPYLLTRLKYGSSLDAYENPDPPYVLLRYEKRAWKRIDVAKIPVKRLRSNMTADYDRERLQMIDASGHLTVQQTRASFINSQPWVMDFSDVTEQTYGNDYTHRMPDFRIVPYKSLNINERE